MSRQKRDEWLRDVDRNQRNTVFPDTVRNEGRFWRNLYSSKGKLSLAQWTGVVVLVIFFAGNLVFLLRFLWTSYKGPWWQRAISAYGTYAIIAAALIAAIYIGNRRTRRRRR